ncbi:MAG: serine/threonine-protein kinase, partial [Eubacteriales bacterium]|nr:serine/threonine-protein kinase [Eubacteriales bacterium]
KSIVRDVPTGRLFYRKALAVYNLQVFSWLKDHRNRSVPRIESFREDEEEGRLVVIEEYVQGRTLENLLEEAEDPLPFHERIRILTEICDGLSFLHSAQPPIIHRDLKASNIMLTEDGVVKIIDYDAAKVYVSGEKKDTVLMGTHGIAAPEQYGFAPSDVRTDIYGLGKLIERMLPDNVDADRVVTRATHIDPRKRYASASQIREQILRIREHPSNLDTRLEKVVPGYDPRSKGQRTLARAVIAVLCAALLAAIGFSVWRFGVYPTQRRQAMTSQLKGIQSKNIPQEDLPGRIEQYLTDYPYEKMTDAEQLQFRNAVEKALSRCSPNQEIWQEILILLTEKCGEETSGTIDSYAQVEKLLSGSQYEKAFEKLRELRASDTPDVEEKWTDALKRCRQKAIALEAEYEEIQTISSANNALKLYALIVSVTDTDTVAAADTDIDTNRDADSNTDTDTSRDTDTNTVLDAKSDTDSGTDSGAGSSEARKAGEEALESFDRLFQALLTQVDRESSDGNYDDADKHYALLQELPQIGLAGQTDLEERIRANAYRKADDVFSRGDYSSALNQFTDLGEYSDAPDRVLECHYQSAEEYMGKEDYKKAVEAYSSCAGYRDADDKAMKARYLHCESCAEKPDDDAYDYIEELTAAGYPGAQAVREVIYQWHVEILNGLDLLMGSQQSSHIQVNLYGGRPDASTHIRLETTDNVDGSRTSWTSSEAISRGGHVDASYNANTYEFSIFEREHTIRAYADDGQLLGSWTGIFTKDFKMTN